MNINKNKGVLLISLISSETSINPNFLMEDKQFVKKLKSLIKQKINFFDIKKKMVNWCQKNY